MKVNGVNGVNSANGVNAVNTQAGQTGMNQITDSYTRNLQSQIANAQKQLQELSSHKELSIEEKMKKRQEIQQQISNLNNQLRQHQIELRKEKQQAKGSSMEDMLGGNKNSKTAKAGNQPAGLSQESMKAMISADTAIGQARVQGSVATRMEGRAGVLEAEIKQDAALGGNTQKKEEELAEAEQIARDATTSQIRILGKANKELEEAARTDRKTDKTSETEKDKKAAVSDTEKDKGAEVSEEKADVDKNPRPESADVNIRTEDNVTDEHPVIYYTPVDVRL